MNSKAKKPNDREPGSTPIGKGIYPVPDAARLTKVAPRRIGYWLGRDSQTAKSAQSSGLWFGQHEPINDKIVLGFLDLQEVRFVDAFLSNQSAPITPFICQYSVNGS